MKESTFCYLVSLLLIVWAFWGTLIASGNDDTAFIASCIFWCSGCIIEMLEKKQ